MAQNTQPQQGRPGQQSYPGPNNPNANPNQGGQQGQKDNQQNLGGRQDQNEQDLTRKQSPTQNPNREEGMKASAERRHRVGEQEQEDDEEEETRSPQSKNRR